LRQEHIEYKFTVDGWNDQENFTGTEACIDPINDGFYNRYHVVAGDITLAPVCFNSCDICTNDITFRVNMNDYVNGGGSTAAGVFLNGTFNGWCGTCTPMADANMDGVWEVVAPIAAGNIEYKFTVDGWNVSEQFVGGEQRAEFRERHVGAHVVVALETVAGHDEIVEKTALPGRRSAPVRLPVAARCARAHASIRAGQPRLRARRNTGRIIRPWIGRLPVFL